MNIRDINPNPHNPRKISGERLKKLERYLAEYGDLSGIVYNSNPECQALVSGHQRMQVFRKGNGKPVILERYDPPQADGTVARGFIELKSGHRYVYREVHWQKEKADAATIIANGQFGEWDGDMLANAFQFDMPELREMGVPEFVFSGVGEIGEGGNTLNREKQEVQEDDYEIPDEIKTDIVPGDLFEIGRHRLLCGDSTDSDAVEKLMDGEKSVLCHADPPYGMGKESDGVMNDNLYGTKLDAFQLLWWSAFRPHLTDNASVYIWGNAEDLWRLWFASELSKREKMYIRNEIVWDKKCIPGMKSDLMTQYAMATERCLYIQLGEQFMGNLNSDQYFNEWDEIRIPLEEMAKSAGLTPSKLKELCGVGMYSHWFTKSQWCLIPRIHYNRLKEAFPTSFNLEYEKLWAIYNRIKGEYRNHINGIVGGMRSYFDNGHDSMYDVWSFSRVTGEERGGHATPKPVQMTGRCIKSSSPEDAIVVEPFGGSGTTMVAAHQLNRRCFMVEITPKYCQVIVDRMLKLDPTLEIKRNGQPYLKTGN